MAEEAVKCFASVLDAVPGMIEELENVLTTSKENQNHMIAEHQRAGQAVERPRKPSVSSSLNSRRYHREETPEAAPQKTEQNVAQGQHAIVTEADALRLAQRKRKTASACSGRQSGPMKYRSRSSAVVYYDGEVQSRFEALVRSIGVCRNSMRKGKMNAKLDMMVQAASSDTEDTPDESQNDPDKSKDSNKMWPTTILPKDKGTPAFDQADGFLDKAQSLCERAAHQVLRDGDCALEINSAKEHLLNARQISETELPALRKRAEKAAEKRRLSEERKKRCVDEKGDDSSIDKSEPDERLGSPGVDLEVDELEVDESEDDTGGEEYVRPIVDTLQLSKFQVRRAGRRAYPIIPMAAT